MQSFNEAYENLRKLKGMFHCVKTCNLEGQGGDFQGIIVRTTCTPAHPDSGYDQHNTLITLFHKGDSEKWNKALEKCINYDHGERIVTIQKVAVDADIPIASQQIHCDFNYANLNTFVTRKLKSMVDCLKEQGLINQSTTEKLYSQLDLLDITSPKDPTKTDRFNARY